MYLSTVTKYLYSTTSHLWWTATYLQNSVKQTQTWSLAVRGNGVVAARFIFILLSYNSCDGCLHPPCSASISLTPVTNPSPSGNEEPLIGFEGGICSRMDGGEEELIGFHDNKYPRVSSCAQRKRGTWGFILLLHTVFVIELRQALILLL